MPDKSFEEAMRELEGQLTGEILEQVHRRASVVAGNTVSGAVSDIENSQMRAAVADILCLNKVVALLHALVGMNLLMEVELQELKDHRSQMALKVVNSPKG